MKTKYLYKINENKNLRACTDGDLVVFKLLPRGNVKMNSPMYDVDLYFVCICFTFVCVVYLATNHMPLFSPLQYKGLHSSLALILHISVCLPSFFVMLVQIM